MIRKRDMYSTSGLTLKGSNTSYIFTRYSSTLCFSILYRCRLLDLIELWTRSLWRAASVWSTNRYITILSKGFASAMFTTLHSISLYAQCSHQSGAVYLCTQRQRRCSVCCPVMLNICSKRVCSYGVLYMYDFYHNPIWNIVAVRLTEGYQSQRMWKIL